MHPSLKNSLIVLLALCAAPFDPLVADDVALTAASGTVTPDPAPVYLPGGPLAGVVLPPFPRGLADESELYPGAVEHFRAYWFKFLPVRSFYDRQSQLKNWTLPEIPGVDPARLVDFTEPKYVLNNDDTGPMLPEKNPPVKALRVGVKAPVFKIELGALDPGVYNLRVIGAVETKDLRPYRKPHFRTLILNSGPGGEVVTWRLKATYVDAFYSVVEFPFHILEKRDYKAELFVDEGSEVELLVRNISLDDALAGTTRRAVKTERTLTTDVDQPDPAKVTESSTPPAPILDNEQRLARDEAIWNRIPNENVMKFSRASLELSDGVTFGVPGKTAEEIEAEWGAWKPVQGSLDGTMLMNEKLDLKYTVDDMNNGRPLPDPYPYKDTGAGLYFPDEKDPAKGKIWMPIAQAMRDRVEYDGFLSWKLTADPFYLRDAAVEFLRYAYQYPTLDSANGLLNLVTVPGSRGRDSRFRQRMARLYIPQSDIQVPTRKYDLLYPYLKGNEELAQSISRFVPWVKTSDDLIKLVDVYLMQIHAKEIMRWQAVNRGWTATLADIAATLGGKDREVTEPLMQGLWSETWIYPLAPAGLQDYLVTGYDRNGVQYIGSTFYGTGERASNLADGVQAYVASGGDKKYDLGDIQRFPKSAAHSHWMIDSVVGGRDFLRIGDVGGPEKTPGFFLSPEFRQQMTGGWQRTQAPRFAWMLKNLYGRQGELDAEWQAIEAAAGKVKRAPWLDLRSREIFNWATILESGLQHDDYRFRRAVYVRTGMGVGHNHADTFDLQGFAHGVPWTIDDGQRSGYSKPNSRFSRIHNTVEVDGKGNGEFGLGSYAWTENLSDAPGAPFMSVQAVPPPNVTLYQRQVALVTVDEGKGSQPLAVAQQLPGAELPKDVQTANSYVFDVFRVAGGSAHLYNFHGPIEDEFRWNVTAEKPVAEEKEIYDISTDAKILSLFSAAESQPTKFSGDTPGIFEATWRLTREGKWGTEQQYLGANFNPDGPRKFTRLHLLGADGMRALRADVFSIQLGYRFTTTSAIRRGQNLQSAFAAIIEPYAGEPFITSLKLLEVTDNETDAQRAVAVEVKTTNGHTDVNLADGRPDKTRTIGAISFAGEYGLVSTDEKGLRQATLSGGTMLASPEVRLAPARREYTATVAKVDYLRKQLTLDSPLPAASAGRVFQIGSPAKWTSYTSQKIDGQLVTVTQGADFLRSSVQEVSADGSAVTVALNTPLDFGGLLPSAGWTVSNDDASKTWRPKSIGGNKYLFEEPVKKEDFGPDGVLRVWEYGSGDQVCLSTFASLRRLEDGIYELTGDVTVQMALKAKKILSSTDQKSWVQVKGMEKNGLYEISLDLGKLTGPLYLKVEN